ncbi:Type IV pilus assembly protein PilM [uncultured Desulfobacterium sp.]|uniref:Type IV pilus assembly protein PilM n=1 Tax=uncultured Desulfobacterium sp. TaxID=201089 RepID=A0A445MXG1_9BACT|nr:Type IV pilus assembly protein PilM [uncultured Desulfobacterium sp.]
MPVSKKNQLIGLDIGSHAIKMVEIDHSKKGMALKNFGMIGLPHQVIVEGSIKDKDAVCSAIKQLVRNLKIKNTNVAASISGFSVIIKKIMMGYKEEAELEKNIQEEAEQYIPFDINEVNLDFDILPSSGKSSEGEDADRMEVMLVAAKKDIINEYVNVIERSGLNPGVMDVDAFALQNAFEVSTDEDSSRACVALVNVGAEELGINAIKKGVSLFTRDSSYGGVQINEAIMSEFKVDYEQAEKIKLGSEELQKDQAKNLDDILKSVISDWVREITRALDFLSSAFPEDPVEKIILAGGSCKTPGFRKTLESETRIPVIEISPFSKFFIDEKHFDAKYLEYMAPQAAVAVGLALRGIGDK